MKCSEPYCVKDAKCLGMCFRHYDQMRRLGRIITTEVELDHYICPPEKRWWEHLPEQSELMQRVCDTKEG